MVKYKKRSFERMARRYWEKLVANVIDKEHIYCTSSARMCPL
mgnify:CR=1 FL=1